MRTCNAIIVICLFMLIPYMVLAQTSSTISSIGIDAKVIAPISGSNSNDLDFGTLTRSSIPGSVTIAVTPEVGISSSGGVTILATLLYSPALFSVTGENNAQFTISLPDNNTVKLTRTGGNEQMSVTGFSHNSGLVLSDTGTASFKVGATLNVGADQVAGDYTGSFSVTIVYQ